MLERFTSETFSPRVGESFRVFPEASTAIEVTLIDVTELGSGSGHGGAAAVGRVPFSLVFRGSLQPVLPQRTYRVEHDGIGEFDLFLVPIGPDAEGMRYEAVFT